MWIFIYILFFGFWFFKNYKTHKFNASTFLLSLYFFSCICSGLLLFFYDTYDSTRIEILPVLYHIVCLTLFLYPLVVFFNKYETQQVLALQPNFFRYLTIITISFCLVSIIYRVPKVISSFSSGDIVAARKMVYSGENVERASNIFEYVGIFGHFFYPMALLLFFVNVAKPKKNVLLLVVLLICSFAEVFQGLSVMGRGGLMRWGLLFVFLFLLFMPSLEHKVIQIMKKSSLIILAPVLFVFYLISSARFADRTEGLLYSVLDYAGQSFIYFSYNFETFFDNTFGGRQVFSILFPSEETVSMTKMNTLIYSSYNLNTFPTFIGSFYLDMGFIITLLISIGFFVLHKFNFDLSKRKDSIVKLSMYLIFTQVVMSGFLYYMFYSPMAIKSFILVHLVVFVLNLRFNKKIIL